MPVTVTEERKMWLNLEQDADEKPRWLQIGVEVKLSSGDRVVWALRGGSYTLHQVSNVVRHQWGQDAGRGNGVVMQDEIEVVHRVEKMSAAEWKRCMGVEIRKLVAQAILRVMEVPVRVSGGVGKAKPKRRGNEGSWMYEYQPGERLASHPSCIH